MSEAALDEALVLLRVQVLRLMAERLGLDTNADEIRQLVEGRTDGEVLDKLALARRQWSRWATLTRWVRSLGTLRKT